MSEGAFVGRWTLLVVTMLFLQVGLIPQFPVAGVVGDAMVALAVCAGLVGGVERGAIVGFWAGVLFDLVRPGPIGVCALSYCIVGVLAGLLAVSVLQFGRPLGMVIVAAGSVVGTLLYAVVAEVFGENTLDTTHFGRIVLIVAALNGLGAPLMLWLCRLAEGVHAPRDIPLGGVGSG